MFYVFNTNGPMYAGSYERLSQIAAVRGVARPAALRSNTTDVGEREARQLATDTAPPHTQRQSARTAQRLRPRCPKRAPPPGIGGRCDDPGGFDRAPANVGGGGLEPAQRAPGGPGPRAQ